MEKCFLWSVNFNVRCILTVFKIQTVSYIFLIMLVGKLGKNTGGRMQNVIKLEYYIICKKE